MPSLKSAFQNGIKEGWALFWSPLTGMFNTAKDVISRAKQDTPNLRTEFTAGLHEGWAMFRSPLSGLCRAVKSIFRSK